MFKALVFAVVVCLVCLGGTWGLPIVVPVLLNKHTPDGQFVAAFFGGLLSLCVTWYLADRFGYTKSVKREYREITKDAPQGCVLDEDLVAHQARVSLGFRNDPHVS